MPIKFERNCDICNKFYIGQGRRFCSKKCQNKYFSNGTKNPFYGKHHSDETKKKLSIIRKKSPTKYWLGKSRSSETKKKISKSKMNTHIGKDNPFYGKTHNKKTRIKISTSNKGRIPWNKNRPWSKEMKKKISDAHIGIQEGKNNPAWLGGKSFEPYGIEFNNKLKEQIRKRDNYICQECSYAQKKLKEKLHIHHIDYNKKNNNLNNLVALCRNCHLQTNFGREDWINYFQDKVGF